VCWMCEHPDATFADYVDEVLQPTIDRCGWAVQGVGATRIHASFSYTVGLTLQGLPELVITGKELAEAGRLLNDVAGYLTLGSLPRAGETVCYCAGSLHFEVVEMPHPEAHLFVATGLFGEARVKALQLVWADPQGSWPWDAGYRGGQPVLGPRALQQRRAG
jgi:hypothetical protein